MEKESDVVVLEGQLDKGRYRYGVMKLLQFQRGTLKLTERRSADGDKQYVLSFTMERQSATTKTLISLSALRCICVGAPGAKRTPFVFGLWIDNGSEHVFRAASEIQFQEWISALRCLCPPTGSQRLAAHICSGAEGASVKVLLELHAKGILQLRPSDESVIECYAMEEITAFGYNLQTPSAWLEVCGACRPASPGRHDYMIMMGGGKTLVQHLQLVYQTHSQMEITNSSEKGFEAYIVKHAACITNKTNCLPRPKQRKRPGEGCSRNNGCPAGWRLSQSWPTGLDKAAQQSEAIISPQTASSTTYPPKATKARLSLIFTSTSGFLYGNGGGGHSPGVGASNAIVDSAQEGEDSAMVEPTIDQCTPAQHFTSKISSPDLKQISDKNLEPMSDKILRRLARKVVKCSSKSTSWKDIAFELGFTSEMIERKRRELEEAESNDVDRVYHFLAEWREQGNDTQPQLLLNALSGADMMAAAEYYALQTGAQVTDQGELAISGKPVIIAQPYMVSDINVVVKQKTPRPLSDSDYATEDSGGRQIKLSQEVPAIFTPPPSPKFQKYRPRANAMPSNTVPYYRRRKKLSEDCQRASAPTLRQKPESGVLAEDEVGNGRDIGQLLDLRSPTAEQQALTTIPDPQPAVAAVADLQQAAGAVADWHRVPLGPRYFGEPIATFPLNTLKMPVGRQVKSCFQTPKAPDIELLPSGVASEVEYSTMHQAVKSSLKPLRVERHANAESSDDEADSYIDVNSAMAAVKQPPQRQPRLRRPKSPLNPAPFLGSSSLKESFGDLLQVQSALCRMET